MRTFKGLEVVAAGYLSKDKILCGEIRNKVDIHEANRQRFFPTTEPKLGRLIAKIFKFRLIYGGTAYSYANDSDFTSVSTSQKYWQNVIDEYYNKYQGLAAWHREIVQIAQNTGRLEMPTGRIYPFKPFERDDGSLKWPRTTILNYPVQGLGADLVAIARVTIHKRLKKAGLLPPALMQSTVHDSIDIDTPDDLCYNICMLVKKSIEDVPVNFERLFGVPFDLPLTAEVSYGPNLKDLKEFKT